MKVGVNARMLANIHTGIGQYTLHLFRELAMLDSEIEYILVVHEEIGDELRRKFPKNVRVEVLPERRRGNSGMRKTWWEQVQVPEFFKKEGVDVAYFPYPSNPWTADWYKGDIRTVVTVHDCIPWKNKAYRRGVLSKIYHGQTRKAVAKADKILTVSEVSAKDIVEICGVMRERIVVVPNDAGDVYKKAVDEGFAAVVLGKFGLKKGRYFLYCGGFDERKNVAWLLDEYFEYARSAGDSALPLVLVGDKLFENKLYNGFEKMLDSGLGRVVQTGFVDEAELAAYYSECRAFVHLSREEGFNIPVLEAANCGAPLILSDIEVHKELAGDSALFVNFNENGAAAAAMKAILNDFLRDKFSEKSLELAKKYSWKKSAQKVLDVLYSL